MDLISAVSFLWYIYLLQYWTAVLLFKKNFRGKFPNQNVLTRQLYYSYSVKRKHVFEKKNMLFHKTQFFSPASIQYTGWKKIE